MKIKELLGESKDEGAPHFGFEDKGNFDKALKAIKEAGIKCGTDFNFGIHYIHFDNDKDIKAAVKVAKKVIDRKLESEW
jgi:hypothetical protein